MEEQIVFSLEFEKLVRHVQQNYHTDLLRHFKPEEHMIRLATSGGIIMDTIFRSLSSAKVTPTGILDVIWKYRASVKGKC